MHCYLLTCFGIKGPFQGKRSSVNSQIPNTVKHEHPIPVLKIEVGYTYCHK